MKKKGGGLVFSLVAGPGGAEGGGGGSTVKGSTFHFIPKIICCQECGVLLGLEKHNDDGPALNSITFHRPSYSNDTTGLLYTLS